MDKIPRISFQNLPPELQAELGPKVDRLGYLGEFFQVCSHQPVALAHFIRFTESLKDALPNNLVEICALSVSTWSGNAYERVQHENLALKLGLGIDWIRDVEKLRPDLSVRMTAIEKAVQRLALSMAATQGRAAGNDADAVLVLGNAEILTGVLMTIGRFIAHSAICNTLKFAPPVASLMDAQS